MHLTMVFFGGFLITVKTSIRSTVITGQTEGLKGGLRYGWMGGWPVCKVWADRWVEREGKGGVLRPLLMKQKKKS